MMAEELWQLSVDQIDGYWWQELCCLPFKQARQKANEHAREELEFLAMGSDASVLKAKTEASVYFLRRCDSDAVQCEFPGEKHYPYLG